MNFTFSPVNTTAVELRWFPFPDEQQTGVILGYKLRLYDKAGNTTRSTTLYGANTTSMVVAGLDIWTSYDYQVCAFTVKGDGPWGPLVECHTQEEGMYPGACSLRRERRGRGGRGVRASDDVTENYSPEIIGSAQLFWATYVRKVHIPNSWNMGYWSSNCSVLNPLIQCRFISFGTRAE